MHLRHRRNAKVWRRQEADRKYPWIQRGLELEADMSKKYMMLENDGPETGSGRV